MSSTICAAREIQRREVNPDPVGDDWLREFRRLFADEFPAPACPAAQAVEGVGHQRVESNRYQGGEA